MSFPSSAVAIYDAYVQRQADTSAVMPIEAFVEYFFQYLNRFDDDNLGFCGLSDSDLVILEKVLLLPA